MAMIDVALSDWCFIYQQAMGLAQENDGEAPELLRWIRDGVGPVKVFTDQRIPQAADDPAPRKIGLLIEPPGFRPWHYEHAVRLADRFEAVFTYDRRLIDGQRFLFYPFGGSYIREWGIFEKSRHISIITSAKQETPGHRFRHEIVATFGNMLDLFGEPYRPYFTCKADALRPYLFSIVVESERRDWYFTEKLIDAFSQGSVPIYWGCPDIGRFFDIRGIIPFSGLSELSSILPQLRLQAYTSRLPFIQANLERARQYRIAEDWIMREHGDLLRGGNGVG